MNKTAPILCRMKVPNRTEFLIFHTFRIPRNVMNGLLNVQMVNVFRTGGSVTAVKTVLTKATNLNVKILMVSFWFVFESCAYSQNVLKWDFTGNFVSWSRIQSQILVRLIWYENYINLKIKLIWKLAILEWFSKQHNFPILDVTEHPNDDNENNDPSWTPTCSEDKFLCPGSSDCIWEAWLCDHEDDCPGGEDESKEVCADRPICDKNMFR